MLGVEIKKNFLDKELFKDLQKLIMESEFSWFQRKTMVLNSNNNLGYFTHSFFNKNIINCNNYFKYIIPIINKLNACSIIEIRANLTPSVFYKDDKSDFHIDYPYNNKTAILYLHNCDGGTEFKIKDKIEFIQQEENKIVIFDSNIEHRGVKSKNTDFRYFLNFNYYQK